MNMMMAHHDESAGQVFLMHHHQASLRCVRMAHPDEFDDDDDDSW